MYGRDGISEANRFQIEEDMVFIGESAYESLGSSSGILLSLAELDQDTPGYSTPSTPVLRLKWNYCGTRRPFRWKTAWVVIQPVGGGNSYSAPSGMTGFSSADGNSLGSNSGENIALPSGIAPGRYRVFYRLMNDGKIVSEGHGFETEIPVPTVSANLGLATVAQATPRPPLQLRKSWINSTGGGSVAIFAALVLQAFARGRRARWRMRRGLCPDCGYDLRASNVRCPECGRPVSGDLGRGVVRRRLLEMARAGSILVAVVAIGLWVRSYWAADCVTRTAGRSADALYSTRGAIVFEHSNADDDYGWTYEHVSPAAFPRSVGETVGSGWRVLGLEYSRNANMAVVPCWVIIMAAGMMAALLTRAGRSGRAGKPGRFGISRTATGTAG
jgi:hypothetical protein